MAGIPGLRLQNAPRAEFIPKGDMLVVYVSSGNYEIIPAKNRRGYVMRSLLTGNIIGFQLSGIYAPLKIRRIPSPADCPYTVGELVCYVLYDDGEEKFREIFGEFGHRIRTLYLKCCRLTVESPPPAAA